MIRAPSVASIKVTEARVNQSRRDTRAAVARMAAEVRATLSRPSTLALAAGAGVIAALCFPVRRPTLAVPPKPVAAAGLLSYGFQYLPLLVRFFRQRD